MRIITLLLFLITCSFAIQAQPSPIQLGAGNTENVIVTSSSSEGTTQASNTIQEVGLLPNLTAASRFLGQATLGANMENITTCLLYTSPSPRDRG